VNDFWQVDAGDEPLWAEAGLVGADLPPAPAHSPKYHYAGAATRRLLAALPAGADGARTLRYVNPATGGPVMPALDCHAVRLAKGPATRPKRSTCNLICLVVSGSGRSIVGETAFEWSEHDVFTVPHWTFASHTAHDGDADLFVVSDRAAIEHLGLYREEIG
jgi:gentisate 1,2-dioxygenase